jgi:mannose-6-phosphate isomerase
MKIEKLTPAFKDYIWGGNKLKEKYGKRTDLSPCAESWELSEHKDGLSTLSDGRTIAEAFSADELGENVSRFDFFPMLIKFIDAASDLSVQVHPSDEYALEHEQSLGKTELWYVIEAEAGAGLYVGFKKKITKSEYEDAIKNDTLCSLLNFFEVKAGDFYFIPAGTVHAIGRGCLICEIQQNSNVTYRVYDHGRVGKDGKPRELHVAKALDVSSTEAYIPEAAPIQTDTNDGILLGSCDYFESRLYRIEGQKNIPLDKKSFRAVSCVEGEGFVGEYPSRAGDTFFVSACDGELSISGKISVIVSFVPDKN